MVRHLIGWQQGHKGTRWTGEAAGKGRQLMKKGAAGTVSASDFLISPPLTTHASSAKPVMHVYGAIRVE